MVRSSRRTSASAASTCSNATRSKRPWRSHPGIRWPPEASFNCTRPGRSTCEARRARADYARSVTERAPRSRQPRVSEKLSAIAESATLKVDAKAKALQAAGRPVISYAAGEPDFATPQFVVDAAAEALHNPGNFRYTPAAGLPVLREAIAAKTLRDSG